MASKVNTKFVVMLSVAVVVVLGGLVAASVLLVFKSGADLAKAGDAAMAKGDLNTAVLNYSKAVAKEKTNVQFLEKWRESIRKLTPDTQLKYGESFNYMVSATRQLAIIKRDDIAAQREYLAILEKQYLSGQYNRDTHDFVVREADTILAYHQSKPAGGEWESLKRVRGLAKARTYIATQDAREDLGVQATDDLNAALGAVQNNDADLGGLLEAVLLTRAQRAEAAGKLEDAAKYRQEAAVVVDNVTKAGPDDPQVILSAIRRKLNEAIRQFQANSQGSPEEATAEFQAATLPMLDKAFNAAKQHGGASIDRNLIIGFRDVEQTVDPKSLYGRTEELLRLALEANPTTADLIAARAEIMSMREDYTGGIAQLQQIVDMPFSPVSLDGLKLFDQKNTARFVQALWQLKIWQGTKEGPDRDAALAKVRERRATLAQFEEKESPRLQLIDAWLAYSGADYQRANQMLETYHRTTRNSDPEALYLSAQVALRLNQLGAARSRLDDTLKIAPNSLGALLTAAQVETNLQNYERASDYITRMLTIYPSYQPALDLQKSVTALRTGNSDNPVAQALLSAERLSKECEGKPGCGESLVDFLAKKADELKQDPLVVRALVIAHLRLNNRDGAKAAVAKAIAVHPDNKLLKQVEVSTRIEDETDVKIQLIDMQEGMTDLDRALAKYSILRSAGRRKEADEQRDKAAAIAPTDKRVVEAIFMDAAEAQDWVTTEKMVQIAQQQDIDTVGGRTFIARQHAARGNINDSVRIMEEVVQKGGQQPEAWRLLGRMQMAANRSNDAVASMRQALKLRPNDLGCINDLLGTLSALNRRDEALALARESSRYAEGDASFMNGWMTLEAEIGDKALARRKREDIATMDPKDRVNLLALADLYMDTSSWDQARTVIDKVRATADGIDAVLIDASWHWQRRNREKSLEVFDNYIAKQEKPTVELYMMYARFLLDGGDVGTALSVLDRGRGLQDPKIMQVDKVTGDTMLRMGQYAAAAERYGAVVKADADDTNKTFRKRYAECLMKSGKATEAEAELSSLLNVPAPDAMTLLLASDLKGIQKDPKGQRAMLDQAVRAFNNDPAVFLKRAQLLVNEETGLRDAMADLDKAIQLDPGMWQAYRLRAMLRVQQNKIDDALADLGVAIKLNPYDDNLRNGLVADLLRMEKVGEAETVAVQSLAGRPRDLPARLALGSIFLQSKQYPAARRFLKEAFQIDSSEPIAQQFLDALLNGPAPGVQEAEQVFQVLGARVSTSPGLTMAVAKVRMAQGRGPEAGRLAVDSLKMLNPEAPGQMIAWYNDVRRMLPDTARLVDFLEKSEQANVAQNVGDWLKYFRGQTLSNDDATRDQGITLLQDVVKVTNKPTLKMIAMKLAGAKLWSARREDEAVAVMRATIEAFPDDIETLNNLAYILNEKGKTDEALPLAETAANAAPNSPEILDTLGAIYLSANRVPDALKALEKASLLATEPNTIVSIAVHLATALDKSGDKVRAKDIVDRAARVLGNSNTAVEPPTRAALEKLKTELGVK